MVGGGTRYFHHTLPPLPKADYPREFLEKPRTWGFYVASVLVYAVWSVTPASYAYLLWYAYSYLCAPANLSGSKGYIITPLAGYAAIEVAFSIYYAAMGYIVQPPAPGSTMRHDDLSDLFLRVLHAGLRMDPPLSRARAYSAPGRWAHVRTSIDALLAADAKRTEKEESVSGTATPNGGVGVGVGGVALSGSGTSTPLGGGPTAGGLSREQQMARRRLTRLDSTAVPPDPPTPDEEDPLFDSRGNPVFLAANDPRAVEFREQLRTWFDGAPWESLRKDDLKEWLAWAAFGLPLDGVEEPKKIRFLERTFTMLEARTGTVFAEGRSDAFVLRLTLDPVRSCGRPFIIYAIANAINTFLKDVLYPMRGVELCRVGDIDYFVRIPPGWTPERGRNERNAMPIVYMHGLGFGLLQNHLLLKHLVSSLPSHPLLVPLAHHTAHGIFHRRFLEPWTRRELVAAVKEAVTRHGFWDPDFGGGVSLLSHSNGSVHHAWVLKDCPEIVQRNTFVDPVVFGMWEGDVCFNFVYRKPREALELLLEYFVATEVGIANYIQRNFSWCDNTLFIEEIPNATDPTRTAFFIGGQDIIIDAGRTRRYLERNGVRDGLHWDADGGHGDGLIGPSRDRVVMYVGTGSTSGWEGWLTRGRRSHSLGRLDRPATPVLGSSATVPSTTVTAAPAGSSEDDRAALRRRARPQAGALFPPLPVE